MNSFFHSIKEYSADAFVADYTNQTNSKQGVCILETAPDDIYYFHLQNPRHIVYWGVNFEENPSLFKGINQCECMFVSKQAKKKGWICLVELKYCKEKNIEINSESAFFQLKETLKYLIEKEVIDPKRHRIYLNVSIPEFSAREPFLSFMQTQDEIIEQLQENKIQILGYNRVLIMNEAFIKIPKE